VACLLSRNLGGAHRRRDGRGGTGKCTRLRHYGARRMYESWEAAPEGGRRTFPTEPSGTSVTRDRQIGYETMRARGWSKVKLVKELGVPENLVRRLLNLHHRSHMRIIDEALAKMNAEFR
jgi:hypothetical protein